MVAILGSIPRALLSGFSYCCLVRSNWGFLIAPFIFTTNVKPIKVDNYTHFKNTIHQQTTNNMEKHFLNFDRLYDELLQLYKDARDGWLDDNNRDFLLDEASDDCLEEMAWERATEFDRDMGKYLNMKDHKIWGNFNNIDYDYPHHINGVVEYDTPLVNAMIARLNAGEQSEQADADRDWLVDWFWETFGSWGLKYNFDSWIADLLYEFENEEETV